MTSLQAQILELFQKLSRDEQLEIVAQLCEQIHSGTFYDRLAPKQRAELDLSIAEADRGEGTEASVVMARLAKKFGLADTVFSRLPAADRASLDEAVDSLDKGQGFDLDVIDVALETKLKAAGA